MKNDMEQVCGCSSNCCGSNKKTVNIDFLYLDLNVCNSCQGTEESLGEALNDVAQILKTTDVDVKVNKIHVTSEEQAIKLRLLTSPTIRINGRDIQLDVKEDLCKCCSDLCGDETICRVWVYQGKEYDIPPKAIIIDAILREVYGNEQHSDYNEAEIFTLPDNLKRFFSTIKTKNR